MATANNGFGNVISQPDLQPNTPIPGIPNGLPVPQRQPPDADATRQSFMSPNLLAPYYNAAGVAGNVGTAWGGGVQPSADFVQNQFSPNLTPMEQTFLGAGLGNALVGLNEGMQRQESQFEETPFHTGLPRAQGDTIEQMMRDLLQTGSQMGLQRQQTAAGLAGLPSQMALGASQVPVQMEQQAFQQANQGFMAPYQLPMQVWSGIPVSAPAIISQSGGK